VTATVTVANQGPDPVDDAAVAIETPEMFQVLSYATTHGTCSLEGSPICSLGRLEDSETATISLVLSAYASGTGSISSIVSGSQADPEEANDTMQAEVTVLGELGYRVYLPLVFR
jgi:hypothetical protein